VYVFKQHATKTVKITGFLIFGRYDMIDFQILSIDGGGIKGIFSAAVLAAIEEDLSINVIDHFDLIAGTSTGGIIALALGMGLRPRDIVEFYLEQGPIIFPSYFGLKNFQHWFMRKFTSNTLEEALKKYFGDKKFGESSKRLVIPAYNLGEDDIYIFRTPHHETLRRDYKVLSWKVGKATSAAPTFFACSKDIDNQRLIDGGIWANNPSLVAVTEAVCTLGIQLDKIQVFSLGTSFPVNHRKSRLNNGGIISWAKENSAIDVILRGQSIGVNNQVSLLLGKNKVFRLDPSVPAGEFSLDNTHKVDDLIAKAAHHSRGITPVFASKFAYHSAAPYIPIYR
jgi:patatin-like phospholipase/acyl hydrolase